MYRRGNLERAKSTTGRRCAQALDWACPIRRLRVQAKTGIPCGGEYDPSTVRRPDGIPVVRRVECEPRWDRRTFQVPDPDITLLIANIERNACAVGRKTQQAVCAKRRI